MNSQRNDESTSAYFSFMNLSSLPSIRRVLVIDPGSRCIKVLLAARRTGGVRVLLHRSIDLPEGDLLASEESGKIVGNVLQEFENLPVAIRLPQQLSISQVIDLPRVEPEQISALIKEETVKFSGLSEGGIVYDYGKLEPFGKYQNPYWVTFAKEEEILGEASRLAGVGERLCEIITPANALIATYQSLPSRSENAFLVELGATSTVVAIVAHGQAAYAINYPVGSDAFTEAITLEKNCSLEAAQALKSKENLLLEKSEHLKLRSSVDGWRFELEKILQDWLRENPELNVSVDSFHVILGGGGARQPGLLEYLRSTSHLRFTEWPNLPDVENELPLDRYAVAYGVALKSLGVSLPSASLFPTDLREARKRRYTQELLQRVTWMLLLFLALLLLFGSAQKFNLARKKKALLKQSQAVLQEAKEVDSLHRQWKMAYEQLRPVLQQQKRTVDALTTLSQLQQVRGDKKLWYVLFADQKSYFAGQTAPLPQPGLSADASALTNSTPPGKYGFIAELSLAEEGEAMRQTLSKVVAELKKNTAFTNVDTLPLDQRKYLVNTNVIIPDRTFSLSIELAENTFLNPLPVKPPPLNKRDLKTNSHAVRPAPGRIATPPSNEKN